MSEANVLGQRTRKVNIDLGLAERVNREVAEQLRNAKKKVKYRLPPKTGTITISDGTSSHSYEVDLVAADNRALKPQTKWNDYWADAQDRRVMMSSSDFYGIARALNQIEHLGNKEEKIWAHQLLSSFRKDWDSKSNNTILLNTQVDYTPERGGHNEVCITNHILANDYVPVSEARVFLPQRNHWPINELVKEALGQVFLKYFFGTDDDPGVIVDRLSFISQTESKNISVNTCPFGPETQRESKRCCAVKRYVSAFGEKYFFIDANWEPTTWGRTRGIKMIHEPR